VVAILSSFLHIFLQSMLLYIIYHQTESVTLKDEHTLTAFDNSVLKRIFGTEREKKLTGG
jgi:hypothetical protein